jgi:hypothetical protein
MHVEVGSFPRREILGVSHRIRSYNDLSASGEILRGLAAARYPLAV